MAYESHYPVMRRLFVVAHFLVGEGKPNPSCLLRPQTRCMHRLSVLKVYQVATCLQCCA